MADDRRFVLSFKSPKNEMSYGTYDVEQLKMERLSPHPVSAIIEQHICNDEVSYDVQFLFDGKGAEAKMLEQVLLHRSHEAACVLQLIDNHGNASFFTTLTFTNPPAFRIGKLKVGHERKWVEKDKRSKTTLRSFQKCTIVFQGSIEDAQIRRASLSLLNPPISVEESVRRKQVTQEERDVAATLIEEFEKKNNQKWRVFMKGPSKDDRHELKSSPSKRSISSKRQSTERGVGGGSAAPSKKPRLTDRNGGSDDDEDDEEERVRGRAPNDSSSEEDEDADGDDSEEVTDEELEEENEDEEIDEDEEEDEENHEEREAAVLKNDDGTAEVRARPATRSSSATPANKVAQNPHDRKNVRNNKAVRRGATEEENPEMTERGQRDDGNARILNDEEDGKRRAEKKAEKDKRREEKWIKKLCRNPIASMHKRLEYAQSVTAAAKQDITDTEAKIKELQESLTTKRARVVELEREESRIREVAATIENDVALSKGHLFNYRKCKEDAVRRLMNEFQGSNTSQANNHEQPSADQTNLAGNVEKKDPIASNASEKKKKEDCKSSGGSGLEQKEDKNEENSGKKDEDESPGGQMTVNTNGKKSEELGENGGDGTEGDRGSMNGEHPEDSASGMQSTSSAAPAGPSTSHQHNG